MARAAWWDPCGLCPSPAWSPGTDQRGTPGVSGTWVWIVDSQMCALWPWASILASMVVSLEVSQRIHYAQCLTFSAAPALGGRGRWLLPSLPSLECVLCHWVHGGVGWGRVGPCSHSGACSAPSMHPAPRAGTAPARKAVPIVPRPCDPSTPAPGPRTLTASPLARPATPTTRPAASSPATQSSTWGPVERRCRTASSQTTRAHLILCPSSRH